MTTISLQSSDLVWEADLPLFGRAMFLQWSGAMLATLAVVVLILLPVFAARGDWDALPVLLVAFSLTTIGLWLLGLLIMALLFRGHVRVRYTLTDKGAVYETVDRVVQRAGDIGVVLGAMTRSPHLLGSGLTAKSRQTLSIEWRQVARVDDDPQRHFVTLRNSWRAVMWLQCTPQNHADVVAFIGRSLARARKSPGAEAGRPSPLPRYLLHSALTLLACVPLFLLSEEFHLELLIGLLVMCFALATLWLIPLFGWVVLAGVGWMAVELLLTLVKVRPSAVFPRRTVRELDLVTYYDLGLFVLAALGTGYLVWLSVSALRGKLPSMLIRDQS